jgi:hypothetical protein
VVVANILGGLVGSLVGAFVAALIVQACLKVIKWEKPRYWNAYKAAAIAGVVSYSLGLAAGVAFGEVSILIGVLVGFLVQILVYVHVLELPSGDSIGYATATLITLMQMAFGVLIILAGVVLLSMLGAVAG